MNAKDRFLKLQRKRRAIIILNDKDHEIAMRELIKLVHLDPKRNTSDGRRLTKLAKSIERYEVKRWPIK